MSQDNDYGLSVKTYYNEDDFLGWVQKACNHEVDALLEAGFFSITYTEYDITLLGYIEKFRLTERVKGRYFNRIGRNSHGDSEFRYYSHSFNGRKVQVVFVNEYTAPPDSKVTVD